MTAPAATPAPNPLASEWAALDPAASIEIAKSTPLLWFTSFARIVDKSAKMTGEDEYIKPFTPQVRLFAAYQWCIENKVPIRLIAAPKPRQSGVSSATCAICVVHSLRYRLGGMVIGDEADRTDLLWSMFNSMVKHDRIRSKWKVAHEFNSEKATFTYKDGKDTRTFEWGRDTANDPGAGSSGTRQIMWFSEVGKYSKQGVVTDTMVISNASDSVPLIPLSMIILESVADGAMGALFDMCRGAVTLEQRKAGRYGNGYIKVFCAWWEIPDYQIKRTGGNGDLFSPELDDREKRGVALYKWTPEQIAWRRHKILEIKGNIRRFDEEFPESEEVAFQSTGSPRFNIAGVMRLETAALLNHGKAAVGGLTRQKGVATNAVQFIPGAPEWLWLRERPMIGARYLVFGDYMTGVQSEGSVERDAHAVGVWRAPYVDLQSGQPRGAKMVAAIICPDGVRWADSLIAERTHLLSQFFGNCIITMEVNEALGILAHLTMAGANLWKRDKVDDTVPGQTLQIPGWKTTKQTKKIIVGAVEDFINDPHSECDFKPFADQCRTFVTWPDGHEAASKGNHDDWVMGGGIGLALIGVATEIRAPEPVQPRGNPIEYGPRQMTGKGSTAFA